MTATPLIRLLSVGALALAFSWVPAHAVVIVDDTWADGGRDDGADPLDSNWWTSSSSSGIEVSVGSLGLVTGTSGRGIHTIFPSQALAVGESIKATATFTTPTTIGTNKGTSFRIGFFDDLGRAGLNDNVSASSGSPNPIYNILPGYIATLDVDTGSEDIDFREHDLGGTGSGRLMATTSNFNTLSSGGPSYTWAPNTEYTIMYEISRDTGTDTTLSFSLANATGVLSSYADTDSTGSATDFAMFGFHVNSNVFGSTSSQDVADNGIDFSRIIIERTIIPEPGTALLLTATLIATVGRGRRS